MSVATWLVLVSLVLASSTGAARADAPCLAPHRGEFARHVVIENAGTVRRVALRDQQPTQPCSPATPRNSERLDVASGQAAAAVDASVQVAWALASRPELVALPPPRA